MRDVYISAKGVGGVNHPLNTNPYNKPHLKIYDAPNQHYRSTEEMLECFSFLPKEKVIEIVVTNTNKIADLIEPITPIINHLFTPHIENCSQMLTDLCFETAHKLYGDQLHPLIETRLQRELKGIIDNGYSVIYHLAIKIIEKSNKDGFMVGSRGSVGSSFVATMSNITEVNPLPPHYRCPKCRHFELSENTNYLSGFDLPEKKCPVCGEKMIHDGQNIPFETFLGFNADKVPDIDLNFPSDYQARAHAYLKVLFGESNVFRAGTIETVAVKTAFGYARGYFERMGFDVDKISNARISFLASKCEGVKRTTGQHPGGIVVIPKEYEVFDFTPIQYPADDKDAEWKTTHLDFHSIHDTVLKLDLLGHVDPQAIKMMGKLANINIKTIPMNDAKVLSLFTSNDALNRNSNYLNIPTGALAIPEFGTNFVQGLLTTAKPLCFSDLLIVSGLSHGTNVWQNNAETLLKEGIVSSLKDVIGCRDDIMTYLISKNLPSNVSFSIMEDVRKGKKLKPEYEEIMRANQIPEYYIDSCNKIAYMFPKAHATAYVMQAIRVGYFKIYYPLAFYATFFTVRSKQYDIKTMISGEKAITEKLDELRRKKNNRNEKISPKEEEILKTLTVAIEMVERGYKFVNIDIYRSDAANFVIDEEHKALIPPFITIDGLGENAAITVIEARSEKRFTSKEDLSRRTKLNGTNINDLVDLGALDDLPNSEQISLFD